MRYLLAPENTLIVRGPASFQLISGEATVLGAPLNENTKLTVRQEKQLPLEARAETDLEINLGAKGSTFEVQGSTIPSSWNAAAEALADMEQGKVMVIGASDVGKSTLSAYLVNRIFANGTESIVVDGDIGQADIGPPTTIGLALSDAYISSLVDLKPEALLFIGHTTPSQVQTKLIDGIRRLSDRGRGHESLTIINTDGWVVDPEAVIYKIRMIETIQPDLILGISIGSEIQPILSGARGRSMRIEAPQNVLTRSRSDRRQIRTAAYRKFLEGATTRTYPLNNVKLKPPRGVPSIQSTLDPRNLIVGLLDEDGYLLQIGILLGLEGGSVRLYARAADPVREIELGHVKLSKNGEELGYLDI